MLLGRIIHIGQSNSLDFQQNKLRRLFNIMNLVGALIAIPQIIIASSYDNLSAFYHFLWMIACLLSLPIHKYLGFKVARLVSFTPIIVFGFLAAARLGPDTLPHLASYGITVFIFLIYDFKREWPFLLFFLVLEICGIILVESKVLQVGVPPSSFYFAQRLFLIVGVLLFILMEFVFFIQLTNTNERKIIDELKKVNAELTRKNDENRLLLKEVHHRVKNNLQLVSSLLNMQAISVDNEELNKHFGDAAARIRSIALLHQKVYQGETLNDIDFKDYLEAVAEDLLKTYCPEKRIELDLKSDIVKLDNDALMPIALIFNELISNSVKHGLRNVGEGKILISVEHIDKENYELSYCDSGEWIEPSNKQTLGLDLIKSLSEQLEGEFKVIREGKHTCFKVIFRSQSKSAKE